MSSQCGEAWVFNTMVEPSVQPEESNNEGISLEEKWWCGQPKYSPKQEREKEESQGHKNGMEAWKMRGECARPHGKIDPEDVEEEEEPPLESVEERMRKRAKERTARISGPREEEGGPKKRENRNRVWKLKYHAE